MTASKLFRVESFVASIAIKAPVVTETTVNITLSGLQTVNGVVLAAGDRVLVKDQTDPIENGIYEANTSAWGRAPDWDGERDATNGTLVIVARATTVALWQMTGSVDFTPGTDAATFAVLATVDLAGRLADTATGEGASLVAIEDAAGNFTATDVEGALAELGVPAAVTSVTKLKLAFETVVSSTALQNDDELNGWNLVANKHYYLEADIFGSQNVGGIRVAFAFSNTPSESGTSQYSINDATGDTANMTIINSTISVTKLFPGGGAGGLNDGQSFFLKIRAWFRANASVGGTMDFQWAQETVTGNATTLSKGSRVTLEQLD